MNHRRELFERYFFVLRTTNKTCFDYPLSNSKSLWQPNEISLLSTTGFYYCTHLLVSFHWWTESCCSSGNGNVIFSKFGRFFRFAIFQWTIKKNEVRFGSQSRQWKRGMGHHLFRFYPKNQINKYLLVKRALYSRLLISFTISHPRSILNEKGERAIEREDERGKKIVNTKKKSPVKTMVVHFFFHDQPQ